MRRKITWLYGLSGAGKSTLSNRLHEQLKNSGEQSIVVDADAIRTTLNKELKFTVEDRAENNLRIARIASWLHNEGFHVIVNSMLPTISLRDLVKHEAGYHLVQFVWIKCDWAECCKRDTKGLYTKHADGELKNFSGPGHDFEPPYRPDVVINTTNRTVDDCSDHLWRVLSTMYGHGATK